MLIRVRTIQLLGIAVVELLKQSVLIALDGNVAAKGDLALSKLEVQFLVLFLEA